MTNRLPQRSLCLIRHGETSANRDGIIAGRLDVPLTDTGRRQARDLRLLTWDTPIAVFSSPMARAQETCHLGFPDQAFLVNADLRERDWGVFEGRPLSEQPPRDSHPPQGERWPDMIDRVAAAIATCCAEAGERLPVIVCHSGVIRALRILSGQGSHSPRPANAIPIHFTWTGTAHQEIQHAS
ncbi:histidine phosphatase family protein [Epibacterium sp. MM17-32]|uniref:histidine phosphatase family protein n=1 Tax=Epibacterium sp. MM17-32 TaxID=2917734 RepID=UPI001EF43031|nr:histidine phosphatase family protein [Epibacterium sp. MM17-32]MCG7629119.1 histidine phosphatase family protein [Epibacterium sp. MM17-32]